MAEKKLTNKEVVELWKAQICARGEHLDGEADKGGHDWHSLWTGFVIALGRGDLSDWCKYMRLGFPHEITLQ